MRLTLFLALVVYVYSQSSLNVLSYSYVNDYEVANTITPAVPTFFFEYTLSSTDFPMGGFIELHPGKPANSKDPKIVVDEDSTLCRSEYLNPGTDYIKMTCLPGTGDMGDFASFQSGNPIWAVLYVSYGNFSDYFVNATALNIDDEAVSPSFCTSNAGHKSITAVSPWNLIGSTEIPVRVVCVGYCFAVAANDTSDSPTIFGFSGRLTHGTSSINITMQDTTVEDIVLRIYELSDYSRTTFDPAQDEPIMPTDGFTAVPLTLYDGNRVVAKPELTVVDSTTVVSTVWLEQTSYVVLQSTTDTSIFYGVSPPLPPGRHDCLTFTFVENSTVTTFPTGALNAVNVNIRPMVGSTFDPLVDVALNATSWNNANVNLNANNLEEELELISVSPFSILGTLDGNMNFQLPVNVRMSCKVACFVVLHDSNYAPIGASPLFLHGSFSGAMNILLEPDVNDLELTVPYYLALHYAGRVDQGAPDCTTASFWTNGAAGNPAIALYGNVTTQELMIEAGSVYYAQNALNSTDLVTSSLQNVTTFALDDAFASEGAFIVAYGADYCGGAGTEIIAARRNEFNDILSVPVLRLLVDYIPTYSPLRIAMFTSTSAIGIGKWPANKGLLIYNAGTLAVDAVLEKGITTPATVVTPNPRQLPINEAVLGYPGFICLHLDDGSGKADPNAVVGASDPLDFGRTTQITVNMFDRDLAQGETVFAVIHIDAVADGKPYDPQRDSAEIPFEAPLTVAVTVDIQIPTPSPPPATTAATTNQQSLFVCILVCIASLLYCVA